MRFGTFCLRRTTGSGVASRRKNSMSMLLILATTWTMLSLPVALILGRALRSAGRTSGFDWTDEVEQFLREQASPRAAG